MNKSTNREQRFSTNELALFASDSADSDLAVSIEVAMLNDPKIAFIVHELRSMDVSEDISIFSEKQLVVDKPNRFHRSLTFGVGSLAASIVLMLGYFFLLYQPQRAYAKEIAAFNQIVKDLAQYFEIVAEDIEDKDLLRKIDRQLDQFEPLTNALKEKKRNLHVQRHFVRSVSLAKSGSIDEARRVHQVAEELVDEHGDRFTKFYGRFSKGVIEYQSARIGRNQHGFTNANVQFGLAEEIIKNNLEFFSTHPLAIARFYGQYGVNLLKCRKDELGKAKFELAFSWLKKLPKSSKKKSAKLRAYCRFNADMSLYFNHKNDWEKSIELLSKNIREIEPVPDMNFLRGLLSNNLADSYIIHRRQNNAPVAPGEVNARKLAVKELRIAFLNRKTLSISQNFHLSLVRLAMLHAIRQKHERAIEIFDEEIMRYFPISPFDENKQTGTHEIIILFLIAANSSRLNEGQKRALVEKVYTKLVTEDFYIDGTFPDLCISLLNLSSCPKTKNNELLLKKLKGLKGKERSQIP